MTTNDTIPTPTAHTYTTAAEDAAKIRAELKRVRGWTSSQISVKSDSYSMGSSIDVTIKAAGIKLAVVKEIAKEFERVRRCEYSGEILSGGNRYVSVKFDWEFLDSLAKRYEPMLGELPVTQSSLSTIYVGEEMFLVGRTSEHQYQVSKVRDGKNVNEGTDYFPGARDIYGVSRVLAQSLAEQGEV